MGGMGGGGCGGSYVVSRLRIVSVGVLRGAVLWSGLLCLPCRFGEAEGDRPTVLLKLAFLRYWSQTLQYILIMKIFTQDVMSISKLYNNHALMRQVVLSCCITTAPCWPPIILLPFKIFWISSLH